MRAGVQPGVAALHDLHVELAQVQVGLVDGSDFQLAPGAGLDRLGDVHDLLVVEVQAGDSIVAFGLERLFLDAAGFAVVIEGHDAIAFGVLHMVGKHCGTARLRLGLGQQRHKVMAVKDVVAQHQRAWIVSDKVFADEKGLRQAVRAGLHGVLQIHAPLAAVAQQLRKARRVLRRADDQDVANAGQHQGAERVVNHGLVIHRQQLLADGECGRVQPAAGAAGEDEAFAGSLGLRHVHVVGNSCLQRISASMRSTPCCQAGNVKPKVACSLAVFRRELCGRRAGVGNALVGTQATSVATIFIAACSRPACAITCFAYPFQVISPLAARW